MPVRAVFEAPEDRGQLDRFDVWVLLKLPRSEVERQPLGSAQRAAVGEPKRRIDPDRQGGAACRSQPDQSGAALPGLKRSAVDLEGPTGLGLDPLGQHQPDDQVADRTIGGHASPEQRVAAGARHGHLLETEVDRQGQGRLDGRPRLRGTDRA